MASRTPLGEINGNRRLNAELTPHLRGIIQGMSHSGKSYGKIAAELNLRRSTVQMTLERARERRNGFSKPRIGRPRKTSVRSMRVITRWIRQNPWATYAQTIAILLLRFSVDTLKRALKSYDIGKWMAAKRPFLTDQVAALRLQWCLDHRNWTESDWDKVVFSDESTVERGSGKRRQWVFRTPKQKWDRDFVQTYNKGHNISIMV